MAKSKMRGFDVLIGAGDSGGMSSFMPWLSMFTGGGNDKGKAEAEAAAARERARAEAAAKNHTVLYTALGVLGGVVAVGGGYFLFRRRR